MKIKNISILLLSIFVILGCNQKPEKQSTTKDPIIIQIPELTSAKVLLLSDVCESVRLVPLETTEVCIIGQVREIKSYRDRFFIRDYSDSRPILEFDSTGKFITQIGGIGNGPGEYPQSGGMAINHALDQILISNPARKNILHYDFDGNFIKDSKVNLYFRSFGVADKDLFYINVDDRKNSRLSEAQKSKFLLVNNSGEIVFNAFNKKLDLVFSCLSEPNIENSTVLFFPAFESSIFEYHDQVLSEKYRFDFGKHAIPETFIENTPLDELDRALRKTDYARISTMIETTSHLYFSLIFKGMVYQCFYSKKSKNLVWGNVIINDLYGLATGFGPQTLNGDKLIAYFSPVSIEYLREGLGNQLPSPDFIREMYIKRAKENPRLSGKDLANYIEDLKRGKFNIDQKEFELIQSIDIKDNPYILEYSLRNF